MKIAAALFGMHYNQDYDHWCFGKTKLDYRRVIKNNQQVLWSNNEFTSVDFYGSTYDSPVIDQLKQDYNFKEVLIHNFDNGPGSVVCRNRRFIEVLNLVKKNYQDYDYTVVTRFDLYFIDNPFAKNVVADRVNVLYRAKWGDDDSICDDCFYYIPRLKFLEFVECIANLSIDTHSHTYNQHYGDFHYMVDGCYYSHQSPIYHINRF